MKLNLFLACVAAILSLGSAALPVFPSYTQCDPRWGGDEMGVDGAGERATVCKEGCAMTSVSMLLAGVGAIIYESIVDPGSLNAYFERHDAYYCLDGDCNNLNLTSWALHDISDKVEYAGEVPKPAETAMVATVKAGTAAYIAHVHDSGHFVLVTGWDPSAAQFTVNDPFYNSTAYAYGDISDVIIFNIRTPATRPYTPVQWPAYKQCDARWGPETMVKDTVCHEGCLMSSTSMALAAFGVTINGSTATPGTLNAWLQTHDGYVQGDDLDEGKVPELNPSHVAWDPVNGMHATNDLSLTEVHNLLLSGKPVIANVFHNGHFVLVTGWDLDHPSTLLVHDPGFARSTWDYSQVGGWRLYNMTRVATALRH